MSIPPNWQMRLPMLKFMADGKECHRSEIFDYLDKEFQFSEEDKSQRLPSGGTRLGQRMVWALAYLKHAKLLENTARGYYKITEKGLNALQEDPSVFESSTKFRQKFAPHDSAFFYTKNKGKEKTNDKQNLDDDEDSSKTPLELIEESYELIKSDLANDLLEQVKAKDPYFFEKLVVDLLLAMGYGGSREEAGQAIGKTGDGGIDGIIKEDKLGLDIVYLQAKRYNSGTIGESAIRNFVGALAAKHAQKDIFITTSGYTKSAKAYVKQVPQKIILIDGNNLVDFMIEHNVGVSKNATYEIKKIDFDYFEE